MNTNLFENSIIVAAHPDDEILWFSSLLNKVDRVLLCYLGELANPDYGRFRQKALSKIANGQNLLKSKISCLEVVALGASKPRSFISPKFCDYGIELINYKGHVDDYNGLYKENYFHLYDKLKVALAGYKNVITHNPWGEYGHVEHVQVYRVVKELQESNGYNIWFSNYCSTRTISLTKSIVSATDSVTLSTDVVTAKNIMDVYRESGCWTWQKNWRWPKEETFIKDANSSPAKETSLDMITVNLIIMPHLDIKYPQPGQEIKKNLKKLTKNLLGIKKNFIKTKK